MNFPWPRASPSCRPERAARAAARASAPGCSRSNPHRRVNPSTAPYGVQGGATGTPGPPVEAARGAVAIRAAERSTWASRRAGSRGDTWARGPRWQGGAGPSGVQLTGAACTARAAPGARDGRRVLRDTAVRGRSEPNVHRRDAPCNCARHRTRSRPRRAPAALRPRGCASVPVADLSASPRGDRRPPAPLVASASATGSPRRGPSLLVVAGTRASRSRSIDDDGVEHVARQVDLRRRGAPVACSRTRRAEPASRRGSRAAGSRWRRCARP